MTREEEGGGAAGGRAREAVKSRNGLSVRSPKHRVEERESTLFPDPEHPKVSKPGKKFR